MLLAPEQELRVARLSPTVPEPEAAVLPLWSRLFDRVPASPLAVGAALGLALVATFLLLDLWDRNLRTLLSGEVAPWRHVEVRSAFIIASLVAGVLVTHRYEQAGTRRDLRALLPALRRVELADDGGDADAVGAPDRSRLRAVGALGAAGITAIVPMLYLDPTRFLRVETYAMPSVLFDLAVGAALGWATSRTLYASVCQDRAFARLAGRVREIDLLDLSPLRPFARRGLRRALRWLLLATIASMAFIDAGYAEAPALVLVGIVAFAMLSFLLPVLGIHARIRAEKLDSLAALRQQIRAERATLDAGSARGGRLADLLAYEARIAAAREWPIDATTLLRFAVFLLLPLGSWLGSAVVGHAVEQLLR